jgi:hypothetical protein
LLRRNSKEICFGLCGEKVFSPSAQFSKRLKDETIGIEGSPQISGSIRVGTMSTTPRGTKQTFERLEDRPDYTQTDTLLNAIYKKVRSGLSSSQKIKLRDDEREWLVKRENLKSDPDAFVAITKERIQTLKTYGAE